MAATAPEFLCPLCNDWVEHKNETCGRCRADPFPKDTFLRLAGLWESARFPSREVCNELLAFNRSYHCHLENCNALMPRAETRLLMRETDHLYGVWDAVRDARCAYYYTCVRRAALKRLRDLIGEEAFLEGRLPSHVPF